MESKKEHILKTALELFASDGLSVPTAKVAEQAGVANGTLFNYFPTKQDLIDELFLSIKKEMGCMFVSGTTDTSKNLKEICSALWDSYVRWALAHPQKSTVMNLIKTTKSVSPKAMGLVKDSFKPFHEMLLNGMQSGEIVDVGMDYLVQIMSAQFEVSVSHASARKLKGKALDEHIATGFKIFWKGIAR